MKLYKEPAEYFYGRCLHVSPKFASPPGYMTEATIRAKVESQIARAASKAILRFNVATEFDHILEEGYVIVGTPDEVAEQLRAIRKEYQNLLSPPTKGDAPENEPGYNTRMRDEMRRAIEGIGGSKEGAE